MRIWHVGGGKAGSAVSLTGSRFGRRITVIIDSSSLTCKEWTTEVECERDENAR
jgi:hypothetical protein